MGEVYNAYDATMHREVAIKVLPPALSADKERLVRFEQEAQAAGALNHPNGNSFEVASPAALFATRISTGGLTGDRNRYVVTADGRRFLVSNVLDEEAKPLTVVLNWRAGLKR